MKMNSTLKLVLAIAMAPFLLHAEETANTDTIILEKTTVTANKMEQDIQEIAGSISVINDVDIEDKGIDNIVDIVKQIPNMSESNFIYQRAINFRGINQSLFTSTNPVVIYSDGVPQNAVFDYDVMLQNVERIEVLRGPQGTLYGKDAIGGVINIISKDPENEWSGSLGLKYGSNNLLQGSVSTNGALINDKLFLSIGTVGEKNDGWVTNQYDNPKIDTSKADNSEEYKLNTTLTATPTERLTAKLILGAKKFKTGFIKGGRDSTFTTNRDDFKNANYDMPFFTDNKVLSQAISVEYDLDSIAFSSLSTHKSTEFKGDYDQDFGYDPANTANTNGLYQYQDAKLNEVTQEFKLSSNDKDSRLTWVTGVYFNKEQRDYKTQGYQYYDQTSSLSFNQDAPSITNGKTVAAFGQASYDLTKKFNLTLGGRYQKIDKDINLTQYNFAVGTGRNASFYTFSEDEETSWETFLPKAALSYAIQNNANVYLSYSKGYLPGGFNYYPTKANDTLKFDAQTSDSYELGIRGDFLNNKLTLGTSLFYMDIDDIHLYDVGYTSGGVYESLVSNGGKAISKGIELDAVSRISANWTLSSALGFTDAKYTKHTNDSFNSKTVRMTPKYTANMGISYMHPKGFYARLDVNNQGDIYFDDANKYKQEAWVTGDIKLGYVNDSINLYCYSKNISNEDHIENYQSSIIYFNEPRTFGAGMKYSF